MIASFIDHFARRADIVYVFHEDLPEWGYVLTRGVKG